MAERLRFPTDKAEFGDDERISYGQVTRSYKLEDEHGNEWEFLESRTKWVPVADEAQIAQQNEIYKVPGVDESEPAVDLRKRKAADGEAESNTKKQKAEQPREERKNTAIYVTSLPLDVTEDEIYDTFSKYGVIAESADTDQPRIKLYADDKGDFKGDALIVYFRPESVPLAMQMLDDSDFRLGEKGPMGRMRVTEADASYKAQKDQPLAGEQAKKKGTGANRDRNKVIKKNKEMADRLADWDDDDPSSLPDTSSRWDKVVVLKQMFTLKELEDDPGALLEIKDDVREECAKFGEVTNVTLYDKEEDGVVTIRFGNAMSAQACIKALDGRIFGGLRVEATIADGNERFKKSRKGTADDDAARLEKFASSIERGGEA